MKEKILEKIARRLSQFGMSQTPEQAYDELRNCSTGCFDNLCAIYRFTIEERNYVWCDFPE